jgi:prepilin-type N-terminal cleavage/methylation domain-containing protein
MRTNKAFTLLEMLVALAIITVGTLGVFGAAARYSKMTQKERENLVAVYLCQEGIEIVKNMRDTNWVESSTTWKDGLTACSSGCQADFDDTAFSSWASDSHLYIEGATGLYKYIASPGPNDVETSYSRKITIAEVGDDELDIQVDVYWGAETVFVKENIYNWRNAE